MALQNVAGRIWFALTADNRQFNASMKRSSKTVSDTERRFRSLQRTLRNVSRSLATPLIGYASIQGLRGAAAAVKDVTESGATLVETGRRIGFTAERLQLLGRVVEGEGGSFDKFLNGLDRFSRSIAEAGEGAAEYKDAFDRIGVSVKDSLGNIRNTEQVFNDVVDGLSKIESKAVRVQTAYDLFGRSNLSLVNAALKGAEGLREAEDAFSSLGVVTNEEAERLKALDQRLENLGNRFSTVAKKVTADFEPAITRATKALEILLASESAVPSMLTTPGAGIQQRALDAMRIASLDDQTRIEAIMRQQIQEREHWQRLMVNTLIKQDVDLLRQTGELTSAGVREEIDRLTKSLAPRVYTNPDDRLRIIRAPEPAADTSAAADAEVTTAEERARRLASYRQRLSTRLHGLERGMDVEAFNFEKDQADKLFDYKTRLARRRFNLERRWEEESAEMDAEAYKGVMDQLAQFDREQQAIGTKLDSSLEKIPSRLQILGGAFERTFGNISQSMSAAILQTDSWGESLERIGRLLAFRAIESFVNPTTLKGLFGGRATGGSVTAGVPVWVGERGKELMVPQRDGYIVPSHKASAGSVVNNITYNIDGAQDPLAIAEQISMYDRERAKRTRDMHMSHRDG